MYLCFVDESGCTGTLPSNTSPIQPLFVISGLVVEQARIHDLTLKFLYLKRQFFPNGMIGNGQRPRQFLDWILFEPKGGDLRKQASEPSRRASRHALRFFDQVLKLIEEAQCRVIGRVWVKGIGQPFDGPAVYTSSVQRLCTYFDNFLAQRNDHGMLIADSRTKDKNAKVSHSVFTQRFSSKGNPYAQLLELPVFGHSDNHAGLQLSDLICSGLLFPLAIHTFCTGHVTSVHVRPGYQRIKAEFSTRIKNLQHRFLTAEGKWSGGIVCSDAIAQQPGSKLFEV